MQVTHPFRGVTITNYHYQFWRKYLDRNEFLEIVNYRHHFYAILVCKTDAELTAVGQSIQALANASQKNALGLNLPVFEKEYPFLIEAGKIRRQELSAQTDSGSKPE